MYARVNSGMYKVTLQTKITNPDIEKMMGFVSEIVFLSRKMVGRNMHILCKVTLSASTDVKAAAKAAQSMPGLKKFNHEIIDQKTLLVKLVISDMGNGQFWDDTGLTNCFLHKIAVRDKILVQSIFIKSKTIFERRLKEFARHNKILDVSFKDVAVGELTMKQHQVLKIAHELGYFDFPKKIGIRGLAKLSGVSTATVLEMLRAAERKIINEYFE